MDPSLQNLLALLTGLGSPTIRLQRIGDFQAFVLSHIPYGQVAATTLQTALIELDGPAVNAAKPPLQWHFGGLPYSIVKAARLDYSYTRMWDGSGANVNASILLGLQATGGTSATAAAMTGPASFAARVSSLVASNSTDQDIAAALLLAQATTVISGASGFNDITSFLQGELGFDQVDALRQRVNSIEFDGPAQDNDSHDPFAYTLGTLFNNQDLYNRLLWWYFGGKATRVTKAIRIPLPAPSSGGTSGQPASAASEAAGSTGSDPTPAPQPPALSLLIGFTGPGSYP